MWKITRGKLALIVLPLVALALISIPIAGCAPKGEVPTTTEVPTKTLSFISPFPPPPAATAVGSVWFMDEITKRTNGRIQFTQYWGGSMVRPDEVPEAIGDGRADLIAVPAPYVVGKCPLGIIEWTFPFRPADPRQLLGIKQQMIKEFPQFDEEFTVLGGKLLVTWQTLSYQLQLTSPYNSLDDLKGKKIQCIALYLPDSIAATGAAPVVQSISEAYEDTMRGMLDGAVTTTDMFLDFKLQDVLKYYIWMDLGGVTSSTVINLNTWNQLSPDDQQLFLQVGDEASDYGADWLFNAEQGMKKTLLDAGVTFYTMSDADKTKWSNAMPDTAAQFAKDMTGRGLPGQQMVDRFRQIAEEQYGWKWTRQWGAQ